MNKINFKDLPDTSTPINAQNLNLLQSNIENTLETYSTNEARIGTWINGKPLYRKVVDIGNLPNATFKDVASGLTNVIVQRIYGRAYNSSSTNTIPLPYVTLETGATEASAAVSIAFNNKNVRVTTAIDRSSWTGYVILEYIKTTD